MKYKVYPSLLNVYSRFENGLVSGEELLDRINRVPIPQTEAQARGVSFEEAVMRGVDEDLFDPYIVVKSRRLLPQPVIATQVYCECTIGEVLFYGFVDVLGATMAVDLKTTKSYAPGRFAEDHQNLYLPALAHRRVTSLRYIITDFTDVYTEEYGLESDFSVQRRQISAFIDFLEKNRSYITDKRIFVA